MPRRASFLPKKKPEGWMINVPNSATPTGVRVRRFFSTRDEARAFAETLQAQYKNEGIAAFGLSAEQRAIAAKAFKLLEKAGMNDLLQVVRDGITVTQTKSNSKPFGEVFDLFINARKRSEIYTRSLQRARRRLGALAETPVVDISAETLEEHLLGLQPTYRNALLREIRAVFAFASKRGWCKENPVGKMDFASHHVAEREVFSVEEASSLLYTAWKVYPPLLPFIAISLFAGVRVFEVLRLRWENIDLDERSIDLPAAITKRRRQRSISMEPVLYTWLKLAIKEGVKSNGPVMPYSSYNILRKHIRNLARSAEVSWKQNALRHSYTSYWLAKYGDLNKLALFLGHAGGLEVLHRFYHRMVKTKEANAYWELTPAKTTVAK